MQKRTIILLVLFIQIFFAQKTMADSCPANSSFDNLSQTCICQAGYMMDKNQCVDPNQYCTDSFGANSSYDSSADKCKCNYGYIAVSGQCVDQNSYCQNQKGSNSSYDSSSQECVCDDGYISDSSGHCISQDSYCNGIYGSNSEYNSSSQTCVCQQGYVLFNNGCIDGDKYCHSETGINSSYDIVNKVCVCNPGYKLNGQKCVAIQISGITPNTGSVGDTVAIQGNNLGDENSEENIYVGSDLINPADVVSWNNSQIVFKIGDYLSSGNISLKTSDGIVFTGPYLEISDNNNIVNNDASSNDSGKMSVTQQININGTTAPQTAPQTVNNPANTNSANATAAVAETKQQPGIFPAISDFAASILDSIKNIISSIFG